MEPASVALLRDLDVRLFYHFAPFGDVALDYVAQPCRAGIAGLEPFSGDAFAHLGVLEGALNLIAPAREHVLAQALGTEHAVPQNSFVTRQRLGDRRYLGD